MNSIKRYITESSPLDMAKTTLVTTPYNISKKIMGKTADISKKEIDKNIEYLKHKNQNDDWSYSGLMERLKEIQRDKMSNNYNITQTCNNIKDLLSRDLCYKNKYTRSIEDLRSKYSKCPEPECKAEIMNVINDYKETLIRIEEDIQQQLLADISLNKATNDIPSSYFNSYTSDNISEEDIKNAKL